MGEKDSTMSPTIEPPVIYTSGDSESLGYQEVWSGST